MWALALSNSLTIASCLLIAAYDNGPLLLTSALVLSSSLTTALSPLCAAYDNGVRRILFLILMSALVLSVTDLIRGIVQIVRKDLDQLRVSTQEAELRELVEL